MAEAALGETRREVPLSKGKLVAILLGCVGFLALAVWLWTIADVQARYPGLYVKTVAGVVFVVFGWMGAVTLGSCLDRSPGLILDAEGIVDNASGVGAGRIAWSEITGFRVVTIRAQTSLAIDVTDPERFVRRASGVRRWLVRLNWEYFGTPVHIGSQALQIGFPELVELVRGFHGRYGRPA
ncbi:MAG: hypothetical protein GX442_21515 [Candidatus Riflebacteria bacterium]|nr:hypothetical protein [Candidatus Riflebacteria bacterium]